MIELPQHSAFTPPAPPEAPSRPQTEFAGTDIVDLFVAACRRFGERPAYKIGDTWLSYSDCAMRVSGIAAALDQTLQLHVARTGKQAVIAVLLPNSHIVLECFFVAAMTRSIVFPANDRLSPAELERGIRASGATILLTSSSYARTLLAINWSATDVETIVWAGAAADVPIANHLVWAPRATQAEAARPHRPRELPTYLHGFNTSGTTGQVKTILHSNANVVAHSLASIAALGLSDEDEHCWAHIGPMFHVGDAVFVWIATLLGARHVFHDNQLQVTSVANFLAAERVTIVKLVPSMLQIFCGSEALKGLRFPDLRWILTGGAAPDAALVRRTSELFGCDFIQGYGMTEATCHIGFKNESRRPSIEGLTVLPGLDLKIVGEDDRAVETGTAGEIAIKGPTVFNCHVLDGKFETPVAGFTPDGFYLSGDLGVLDGSGKLHIVGRKKDMINVGGENVFGWEVERVVNNLPAVKECAAFAMPHDLLGEVVELAVVRTSEDLTVDAIKEHCRLQLASFKVPQRVHFMEQLPRTPTGKLQKYLLREQLKSEAAMASPVLVAVTQGRAEAVHEIVTRYMKTYAHAAIGPDEPLFDAGLDSLGALDLIAQLEQHFSRTVSQTLLYDHPTINSLAAYFEAAEPTAAPDLPAEAADLTQGEKISSTEVAIRRSASTPLSLVLQSVGIFLRPLVLALTVLPVLVLFDLCAQRLSKLELLATGPCWLALLLANTMAIVIVVSRVVTDRDLDQCQLWSPQYFRWLFVHNLFRSLENPLGVLRGSPLLNLLYRSCGAKIGRGVRLHSLTLHDLHRLEIGDHTVVGRDVNLQPAVIGGGLLVRRPIKIGSRCFVGTNATVLGGTQIPDGSVIPTLATISSSTTKFDLSSPMKPSAGTGLLFALRNLLGYLLVGYLVSAAIAVGVLFVQGATEAAGATVPSISALFTSGLELASSGHGAVALWFFAAMALAIYLVIPISYFVLVAVCKRVFIKTLSPREASGQFKLHAGWSHWLFNKLIDVPFFRMHLRLNVMSHVARWNYRLLGARIGARPFMAAPYTAEPELLELADGAMLAGNVSAYGIDACTGSVDRIRLASSAIVANSCVLQAGADRGPSTLLGDLSSSGRGDASPPNTISVGSPPRVVGRSRFVADSVSRGRYAFNQAMLCTLQWLFLSTSNVVGFVAMGVCFDGLVLRAPLPIVWVALLGLPAIPRLVKTAFVPLFKWLVLGTTKAGEFPAYGWMYCKWVLLETVIMDAESTFLTQLHGTTWLNLLWRSLGARVGSNACILSSSLGCEFDLKDVGEEAALQYQSLVFGHSIEHHALLFKPAMIGDRAEIGAGAIIEAGAVVDQAGTVPPSKPVHARQVRSPAETGSASRPDVSPAKRPSEPPPLLQQAEVEESEVVIDHVELADMVRGIIAASGSSEDEARIVADHLVEANLRGHDSHGVGMIPMYLRNLAKGTLRANRGGRIAADHGALIAYDGELGYGQVTARAAIEIGIEQARRNGFAVVALRNAHHIGRVGTYGEMCAEAGLISLHFVNITNQKPSVAPWRGSDARFGTNPVCVAVPAAEPGRPIVLDMATSIIALGKVRVARNKGQRLDDGILLDARGQPTTDPDVMFRLPRGALMTFGEHKGYALAFICELLGGALTGGGTMRPENQAAASTTNGMLTILIDPSRLVERSWFTDEIKAMTDYVTASPPMGAGEEVLIPGDPERQSRARRIAAGIPIDDETWRELVEAAKRLNVPIAAPWQDRYEAVRMNG